MTKSLSFRWCRPGLIFAGLLFLTACSSVSTMKDQPRYDPLEPSTFFPDGRSARSLVDGTVAQGMEAESIDTLAPALGPDGQFLDAYPFPVTMDVLKRGQERYDIYCSPCHGLDGYGQGMIVQRGFSPPPSLHDDRLRQAPAGHFYDVITNGFGQMYPYAYRVPPEDRWAIVAYIRALQLSQSATQQDVPADVLPQLQGSGQGGGQ